MVILEPRGCDVVLCRFQNLWAPLSKSLLELGMELLRVPCETSAPLWRPVFLTINLPSASVFFYSTGTGGRARTAESLDSLLMSFVGRGAGAVQVSAH